MDESWTYIKTVVDVVREPIPSSISDLRVMVANESFYRAFQVEAKDTEGTVVYELGNGQWNIPALRKLLEDILPKNTFFKGFEVSHEFPFIGRKVMILNARQIHKENTASVPLPAHHSACHGGHYGHDGRRRERSPNMQNSSKPSSPSARRNWEIISKNSNGRLTHSKESIVILCYPESLIGLITYIWQTIVTNSPDSGGGAAGWAVAVVILLAIIVGGVVLYQRGFFGNQERMDTTNIDITIPTQTDGNTNP